MMSPLEVMLNDALGVDVPEEARAATERAESERTRRWEQAAHSQLDKLRADLADRPISPSEEFHSTRELAWAEELLREFAEIGQGMREVDDYLSGLELRIPAARKDDTRRRKAEAKAVKVVTEYDRQLAEHGNDESAVCATAEALGISKRSVYRARRAVGTITAVSIGTNPRNENN
ncbi:hypothetical protein CSC82_11590 [Rhodobacteraceae bacterium 4F10]|nr:hypothetical protein CSC82_11590 [Rhodobacteraceae bacterium 4F10]